MPMQNIKRLAHDLLMTLGRIFDIGKNIIQINNKKNVKFFGQNLVDGTLETYQYIE